MIDFLLTPLGIINLFLVLLGLFIIQGYYRSRLYLNPIVAGNIEMEPSEIFPKTVNSFGGWQDRNGKTLVPQHFDFVAHCAGKSLNQFGLPEGTVVFCNKITANDVKRGDILILEIVEGENAGQLKGRKCLGFWQKSDESDQDLIDYLGYEKPVKDYFGKDALQKYKSEDKIYRGPIEGYLKTLSCDENGKTIHFSRPHDPEKIHYRVEHAFPPSHLCNALKKAA